MTDSRKQTRRLRKLAALIVLGLALVGWGGYEYLSQQAPPASSPPPVANKDSQKATEVLEALAVKGHAPKTDYARSQFGDGWAAWQTCDVRNKILARDLTQIEYKDDTCIVQKGTLADPYTGKTIAFTRGASTSSEVQIDHVVALADAWQKGAQQLSQETRVQFANDDLNLLAVDGDANQQKGASDAATWLPKNKTFRCQYIARQIAVKAKYSLWVTEPEKDAMERVLGTCPDQTLPKP